MASTFTQTAGRKVFNTLIGGLIRAGIGPSRLYLLTTVGRKTGRRRTNPVAIYEIEGDRWLVSPYGERAWVHNIRALGEAELRRGSRTERITVEEVDAGRAAPVLREYLRAESFVRPYFDVGPDDPLDAFRQEAPRHPVFRITERPGAA